MRLHHLTTALPAVVASGELRPTWPAPLYPSGDTLLVLWLTSDPDPARFGMKVSEVMTGRVTVDVQPEQVLPWKDFRSEVRPETVSGLETSARNFGGNPGAWYLSVEPIPASCWVEAVELPPDPAAI